MGVSLKKGVNLDITFEEYMQNYPDECRGCRSVRVYYRASIPNKNHIMYCQLRLSKKKCPCSECLVKFKCSRGCVKYNDFKEGENDT